MGTTHATLTPGTRFTAKWTSTPILVESILGQGANGTVYLVRTPLGKAAMKVCSQSADVALEWALLNSLGKGAGAFPKPMLIDDGPKEAPFFYVMEWIPGESLDKILSSKNYSLATSAFESILQALRDLHQAGYAFCDLKPENIVVMADTTGTSIRFVDVGGVTEFSRSVRQYTPLCDRAFYGLGSRKAEATYDLFALLLGFVTADWNQQLAQLARQDAKPRRKLLEQAWRDFPLAALSLLFDQLVAGLILDAEQMDRVYKALPASAKAPLVRAVRKRNRKARRRHKGLRSRWNALGRQKGLRNHQPAQAKQKGLRGHGSARDWTEVVMWTSLCSATVVCVMAWAVLLGWFP